MRKKTWGALLVAGAVWLAIMLSNGVHAQGLDAEAKANLDAQASQALETLYSKNVAFQTLGERASGLLIFPKVAKGGFIVGGEYGEGVMRVGGATVNYYNVAGASLGLQFGVQEFAVVFMFMNEAVLAEFQSSSGWKAGIDATVAFIEVGAQASIDTVTVNKPVLAFPFSQKGGMAGITIQGAKFTKFK